MKPGALLLVAALASGCGYHALYGGQGEGRLHVVLARSLVADAIAGDEVVTGVREGLAREGALAAGDGYPRVEVEVLRADESSEGVASPDAPLRAGPGGAPRARATLVGLVARAWIVGSPDAPHERDTGDVRAIDVVASSFAAGAPDARADAIEHEDALRAAARRVGERLALRVLGHPAPSDESLGRER
jgi:hypothetical protein